MQADAYFLSRSRRNVSTTNGGRTAEKPASRLFRVAEQCGLERRHRDAKNALRFMVLLLLLSYSSQRTRH